MNMGRKTVLIMGVIFVLGALINCGGGGGGGGTGGGGGSLTATRIAGDYGGVGDVVTDGTWLAWIAREKDRVMGHASGSGADTGSAVTALASDDWYPNNIAYDGRYLVASVQDGADMEIVYLDTAGGSSYVAVTDNSLDDYDPKIHDGIIVWYADDGDGNEIFYYEIANPGQGVVQLTNNAANDRNPCVEGGKIVWNGNGDGDNEIYYYDINAAIPTIIQVSDNSDYDSSPEVDESGVVAWMVDEGSDTEIFYADMSLGAATFVPVQLTNDSEWNQDVHVDGRKIVWENFITVNYCDIDAGSGTTVVQVVSNGSGNFYPSISGDRIVWSGDDEIYSHVIGDPVDSSLRVTNNAWVDEEPTITGDIAVWWANDSDGRYVYRYDFSTDELLRLSDETYREIEGDIVTSGGDTYWIVTSDNYRLFSAPVDGSSPVRTVTPPDVEAYSVDMDQGILAYETYGDSYQVHYADLNAVAFTTVQLTYNTDDESRYPVIDNGVIAWEHYRDGLYRTDIYYYDINAVAPTVINVTNSDTINDENPDYEGGILTWTASGEIWYADISVGASTFVVTRVSNNAFTDYMPRVDSGVITWYGNDGDNEIYYADVSAGALTFTVEQLTDNATSDRYPEISNGVIVWEGVGSAGTDYEVYYADVSGGAVVEELTSNDLADRYPVIKDGLITWCARSDDTDYEVYFFDLNAASPAITQVTDNLVEDYYPVSSDGTIFWSTELAPYIAAP